MSGLRSPPGTIRCFVRWFFCLGAGVSEYNYVGSVLHERIPVVAGRLTGLPLPVFSEIVLEGFLYPNEFSE